MSIKSIRGLVIAAAAAGMLVSAAGMAQAAPVIRLAPAQQPGVSVYPAQQPGVSATF